MAGVIVWEWQNEYGNWRPYSPKITAFLETQASSTVPLQLGSIESSLYLYSVDVQRLVQTRLGTGTQRNVRRRVLPSSCPLAKGITWQWEGDPPGTWNDFEVDVAEFIDDCFVKNYTSVDLKSSKFKLPYRLDLSQMTQTRTHTGRVRKLKRVFTTTSYPSDTSGGTASNGTKRRSGATAQHSSIKRTRSGASLTNTGNSTMPVSSTAVVSLPPLQSNHAISQGVSSSVFSSYSMPNNIGSGPINSVPSNPVTTTATSNWPSSSVLSHGPITRRRYHLSQSLGIPPHPMLSGATPTSAILQQPNVQSFAPSQSHTTAGPQFTSFHGAHAPGFPSPMFSGSGPTGLFGGNHMFAGPGFGFPSSMASSSASQVPSGSFNVFTSSQPGRVRPTPSHASGSGQATGTGFSIPTIPIKEYDTIPNFTKSSKKKDNNKNGVTADDILNSYVTVMGSLPENEDCCICYEKLMEASGHGNGSSEDHVVLQLEKCSHIYHKLCLVAMYDSGPRDGSIQCPACKTIYGEKMGNCPRGEMTYRIIHSSVSGYEGYRTIEVSYHISSGTQGPEHPNPGKKYNCRGFPRVGFLPDCDKGRKVLQLLIVAWKRRQTFTIGRSTTTNEDNCVTWNEIHHKTELGSNYYGHGYPDPNYLDNVLGELSMHGISDKDLPTMTDR